MGKKSTMVELVEELESVYQSRQVKDMIREAKAGEYHNYKNHRCEIPKIVLYQRLRSVSLYSLAEEVRDGEYDEEPDEEDLARLRRIEEEII